MFIELKYEFTLPWWFIILGFGSVSSFSSCPSSLKNKICCGRFKQKEDFIKYTKEQEESMPRAYDPHV